MRVCSSMMGLAGAQKLVLADPHGSGYSSCRSQSRSSVAVTGED